LVKNHAAACVAQEGPSVSRNRPPDRTIAKEDGAMPTINLLVKMRLSGEELDIEVDDSDTAGKLAEGLRKELNLPVQDTKGPVTYKLVLQRTGTLLNPGQTLRAAGVQNQDVLSFWGEPTAASAGLIFQRRLRAEYDKVMQRFGRHPNVKIDTPSNPPMLYTVTFRLKGLVGRVNGQLQFANEHVLRITVPEGYPQTAKPAASMVTPAYHPNISSSGNVCIGSGYYMAETIADVIAKVGDYLQYKEVGLGNPYRSEIRDWILSEQQAGRTVGPFDNVGFHTQAE
jgi:hypothetical protein